MGLQDYNNDNAYLSEADPDFSEKTVLVVEDDRSHRVIIDKILLSCGFRTVHAENGYDAITKIDSGQSFDLILMDLDMPQIDGFETTKAIRIREKREGGTHKPIIAFTANRSLDTREQCLTSGMDAYLPKDVFLPRWRETLIDNLQGLISGDFDTHDFDSGQVVGSAEVKLDYNASEFDQEVFAQTMRLLKDELTIAIEEYLEDAAAYINDIEMGLKTKDFNAMGRGSHTLKSNSKGFGLMGVSKGAENINIVCENYAHSDTSLKQIELFLEKLKTAFEIGAVRLQEELRAVSF